MSYESLVLDGNGPVLTVSLSNPAARNAVNGVMHEELPRFFRSVALDREVRVIVLRGDPQGRAFSAGGDLHWLEHQAADSVGYERIMQAGLGIVRSILDVPQPIVSMVDGGAVGLGATIALFADVCFMSEEAFIGDPHVSIGVVAGDGGAALWPLLVGVNRAKEFLMTGERIDARTAAALGLVNHVVPRDELAGAVYAFADRLVAGSRMAIEFTKQCVNAHLRAAVERVVPASIALEGLPFLTADAVERMRRAQTHGTTRA